MILDIVFEEQTGELDMSFELLQEITDGGFDRGCEEGKKAERQALWNAIQNNGERVSYNYAFAYSHFTKETFRPMHDIRPISATGMFVHCTTTGSDLFSMTEVEKECGMVFDFSECENFSTAFMRCPFNEINVLDVSKATSMYQIFYNDNGLKRINRLIFSENTKIGWGAFGICSALKYVGFEGAIAQSIDLQYSPLNKESLQMLIAALSENTSGLTATLQKTAVDTAFETAEGASDGSASDAWLALVAVKPNWNVSLI